MCNRPVTVPTKGLSSPPVAPGDNELAVRLTNRVGIEQRVLNVQELEVKVRLH